MQLIVLLSLCCAMVATCCGQERTDIVATLDMETGCSWGDWGPFEYCPQGQYAYGFEQKVDTTTVAIWDATGTNGIKLLCRSPGGNERGNGPWSFVGPFGEWERALTCNSEAFITGASFRVQSPGRNSGDDDVAVFNVKVFCDDGGKELEGAGVDSDFPRIAWTSWKSCPVGSKFCGIKTRVEGDQGKFSDDTALNDAKFACCT